MTAEAELYGTDWLCGPEGLDPTGREISGVDAVAQSLLNRLETRRGTLIDDDPEYGDDLTEMVSEGFTPGEVAALAARVESQFEADERVATAQVSVAQEQTSDGLALAISASVQLVSGGALRFTGLIGTTKAQLVRAEEIA